MGKEGEAGRRPGMVCAQALEGLKWPSTSPKGLLYRCWREAEALEAYNQA